jgi:acetyltransferase-like isoleucine patch superfamily enzyme
MVIWVSWLNVLRYRLLGIKIGKGSYISVHANIDLRRGKVIIGNNVEIASGSYILSHTGYQPVKEGKMTILEDNVKIFVNSVVLPGIRVGKNSIVGAGSVVMKDVPPNVMVLGNPARVIKHLEDIERGSVESAL